MFQNRRTTSIILVVLVTAFVASLTEAANYQTKLNMSKIDTTPVMTQIIDSIDMSKIDTTPVMTQIIDSIDMSKIDTTPVMTQIIDSIDMTQIIDSINMSKIDTTPVMTQIIDSPRIPIQDIDVKQFKLPELTEVLSAEELSVTKSEIVRIPTLQAKKHIRGLETARIAKAIPLTPVLSAPPGPPPGLAIFSPSPPEPTILIVDDDDDDDDYMILWVDIDNDGKKELVKIPRF